MSDLPSSGDGAAAPLRILFVEDNDYLREVIGAMLERDDRELVTCASAEEGLDLLAGGRFDVIVTDVSLGDGLLSGMDLARRVLAGSPQAWVVVSSGYAIDAQSLGALGPHVRSLAKPVEPDDMDRLLDEVCAAR
jgi:two-component system cell cycle response regulator CpdR